MDDDAAVHRDGLAGDEVALVRGEEDDRPHDVFGQRGRYPARLR
jgi:hypothetical protein